MKKLKFFVFIIINICLTNVYGQDKVFHSIESDVVYYYHFVSKNTHNKFNYGFSVTIWQKIRKIKLGIGANYSTKIYYYKITPSGLSAIENKIEHNIKYLNFPILIDIKAINLNNSLNIDFLSGLILNKVINYNITKYYTIGPTIHKKDTDLATDLGLSLRIGSNISYKINENFRFNATPFSDLKLKLNCVKGSNNLIIPDNRFSIGLKVGIECFF